MGCTSLCNNTCTYCTRKHEWSKCHMYGLGIYLADMAQKSHRYVSQPRTNGRRQTYSMIVCSVLGKSFEVEGYLKRDRAMHDVCDVRTLTEEDLDGMIETCQPCAAPGKGVGASIVGVDGERWGRVVGDSTLGAWLRSKQKVPSGSGANKEKSRWRPSKQRPRRATCCISKAWETVFDLVIRSSTVST